MLSSCEHLDIRPESSAARVLQGTIHFRSGITAPPNAVVVVRILDAAPKERPCVAGDLAVGDRVRMDAPPQVLGEQLIEGAAGTPIPFRIEYTADEAKRVASSTGGRVAAQPSSASRPGKKRW